VTSPYHIDAGTMLVAGFGFRQSATCHSFENLLQMTGMGDRISKIAVLSDKANHPEFLRFCAEASFEIIAIDQQQMQDIQTPSQSEASQQYRQTGSVCEAVALCAGGRDSVIVRHKMISDDRRASCAISAPSESALQPQNKQKESRK
jgi:cobalt-precorrin 5A hydrolase